MKPTRQAAILRISLPMGPSFNRHAGAIDWIQSRFRHGRPATLYFDEVRSCTYTDDLNRVFERFLAGRQAGIFHCGGPRPMTLYQIAQIVNRVGGYDPHLLKGCPRIDAGPMPPRAGNVSMNSDKLIAALGRQSVPAVAGRRGVGADRSPVALSSTGGGGGAQPLLARLAGGPIVSLSSTGAVRRFNSLRIRWNRSHSRG